MQIHTPLAFSHSLLFPPFGTCAGAEATASPPPLRRRRSCRLFAGLRPCSKTARTFPRCWHHRPAAGGGSAGRGRARAAGLLPPHWRALKRPLPPPIEARKRRRKSSSRLPWLTSIYSMPPARMRRPLACRCWRLPQGAAAGRRRPPLMAPSRWAAAAAWWQGRHCCSRRSPPPALPTPTGSLPSRGALCLVTPRALPACVRAVAIGTSRRGPSSSSSRGGACMRPSRNCSSLKFSSSSSSSCPLMAPFLLDHRERVTAVSPVVVVAGRGVRWTAWQRTGSHGAGC